MVNTLYNINKHLLVLCYSDDLLLSPNMPLYYSLSSSSGIVESKNAFDKQMMSILFALKNASTK